MIETTETRARTDVEWERWGAHDPYFSVLTHARFRRARLDDQAKEDFFASGTAHVGYVLHQCRAIAGEGFMPSRVLDFGCGVGRLVIPFARIADQVVGVDVSPSMLAEARRNCDAAGLANVTLVPSDDGLTHVGGLFDLVHTTIVLQHVPPERGRALFRSLLRLIAPDGMAALQVTFADSARIDEFGCAPVPAAVATTPPASPASAPGPLDALRGTLRGLLGRDTPRPVHAVTAATAATPQPGADPVMEMHYYNYSELMAMMNREGVERFVADFTDHGGALGATLFFRRPARLRG